MKRFLQSGARKEDATWIAATARSEPKQSFYPENMVGKGKGYAKTTPPRRGTTPNGVAVVSQPNGLARLSPTIPYANPHHQSAQEGSSSVNNIIPSAIRPRHRPQLFPPSMARPHPDSSFPAARPLPRLHIPPPPTTHRQPDDSLQPLPP
uniref:Uncharacterized protein n=1 Tax=Oryza sativa subsp. japonica TaxID=39947 RepID=Q6YYK1_ORYSJ|nr:hypothetical protein [Oryza sativa Japonica Group]